jgi:hypothetical protein
MIFDTDFLSDYDLEPEETVEEVQPPQGTQAVNSYGPFREKNYYNVIHEERDWCGVRWQGKYIYCPNWVFYP